MACAIALGGLLTLLLGSLSLSSHAHGRAQFRAVSSYERATEIEASRRASMLREFRGGANTRAQAGVARRAAAEQQLRAFREELLRQPGREESEHLGGLGEAAEAQDVQMHRILSASNRGARGEAAYVEFERLVHVGANSSNRNASGNGQ